MPGRARLSPVGIVARGRGSVVLLVGALLVTLGTVLPGPVTGPTPAAGVGTTAAAGTTSAAGTASGGGTTASAAGTTATAGTTAGTADTTAGTISGGGSTATAGATAAVGTTAGTAGTTAGAASRYTPLATPLRAFDTRTGIGGLGSGPLGAGQTRTLAVAGHYGVPAGATAVALNLTAVGATAHTYVTAFSADASRPSPASMLNASAGYPVADLAIVRLGSTGALKLYNAAGDVDLIGDIAGYFTATTGATYVPLAPRRAFDTRSGLGTGKGPIGARQTRTVPLAGRAGIPAGAVAVALNLAAVGASAPTYLTAYAGGSARPATSTLNVAGRAARANAAIVRLGGGAATFYNAAGRVDLIGDVVGYYVASGGATYTPLRPARLFDTRSAGYAVPAGRVGAGQTRTVQVAGVGGVPAGAAAVAVTLTAVGATRPTYLTVYPAGPSRPGTSTLDVSAGTATAAFALARVGSGGKVTIYNAAGSVDLVADVVGYAAGVLSPLRVATTTLPAARRGVPYAATLQAAGGMAPYRWATAAGGLPPGLTLSPAGRISGTPNATGTFAVTFRVTGATGRTATSASLSLRTLGAAKWALQSAPPPGGWSAASVTAVDCPTASFCAATGYGTTGGHNPAPTAATWNGSRWSATGLAAPAGGSAPNVAGVGCWSAGGCLAVGWFTDAGHSWRPLFERWSGTSWTTGTAALPAGATSGKLAGISCVSASFCLAVGSYLDGAGIRRPLAESWNGSSWTIRSAPTPGPTSPQLLEVSCASTSACLAIGVGYDARFNPTPVVEQWHGSTWQVVAGSPAPAGAVDVGLAGVSCPSGTGCLVVGSYRTSASSPTTALAGWWTGSAWSARPITLPAGSTDGTLTAVGCATAASCLVAGGYTDSAGTAQLTAATWTGSSWLSAPPPVPASSSPDYGLPDLTGLSCTADASCTTVGGYENTSGTDAGYAARFS